MDKNSVLYQLMDLRMNDVMNGIVIEDEDYLEIQRKSNKCFSCLEALNLPEEAMRLVDQYVSEQNAMGSRYGVLAYLLGFSDCRELLLGTLQLPGIVNDAVRD